MVLFGLTIVAVAVAVPLYQFQRDSPAHATSNIEEIDVAIAPATPGDPLPAKPKMDIDLRSDGHGGTLIAITSDDGLTTIDTVRIAVPAATWGSSPTACGHGQPSGVSCAVAAGGDSKIVTWAAPADGDRIDIPRTGRIGWGVIARKEYVSVLIPPVAVLAADGGDEQDAVAFMAYHVKLQDDYTWATGVQPQGIESGRPVWPIQTMAAWNPVGQNGTALSVQEEVERDIFLAGAIVGVAAAAFAAAIAELIGTSAAETKSRRRREAEAAQPR